ncbi:carbohydrate kinase family protein [Zeaxanthinibacter enoshimensis]|uniref:Fructokinase n=1 Tax=Zeaxanthinibacter enoshimensis TaxID=392009 RepID=A0A4V3D448_9FLAO|nr:carbohydrate kinase [Zeaxanthinibacter enoshimensis]TDQ32951.1 fructokinase [Zeaxanthinibacter enoshimensis]
MKKVFCIGEALIDFVAEHQGNDLAKASDFTKKAGGAPANVACAIAKLGGRSSFIGSVGSDPFGTFLQHILETHEVDLSFMERSETFTTLAFVSIAEDGERDFVFSRGADRELVYNPAIKSLFKNNMVHLGAATALLGGTLEKSYGHYFFDALTQDAFISFDPNHRADLWKNRDKEFIRKCLPYIEKSHLCKFSLEEARLLSGKEDLDEACKELHKLGTRIITITLGKDGTYVSAPSGTFTVPSIPVTPVDTTGAGDAFIGCLLWQISTVDSREPLFRDARLLQDMVAIANKAGAITTTNFGAIESLPTQRQLQS